MRAKYNYALISLIKLILLPLLIILFAPLVVFFSFKVDTSFSPDLYLYWFVVGSQVFYILLFLISIIKLYYIIKMHYSKTIIEDDNIIGKEISIESEFKSQNNVIKNSILNLDNLNSKNEYYEEKEKDIIFSYKSFYENIPLPLLYTNKDGKILGYNTIAKNFFGIDLNNQNISDFIEILNVHNLKSCNIINIKLHITKNNEFVTSIFQKSILDDNKKLQSVVLIFLPGYINNSLIEDYNNYKNERDIYNSSLNKFNNNLYKSLNITEVIDMLNVGLIIIQKDGVISLANNKSIELLNTIYKYKYKSTEKVYSNQINNNDNMLKYNKETLIGNSFKKMFADIFDNNQILNILNLSKGVSKLEIEDLLYLNIHHTLIDEHIIINLLDITEKRKLELQNSFSQRLQTIGQIASAVAHDFNNLLTAIMSFTYFLKERYSEEDPSSLELEQIAQNSNRAKVMIRQLLTFSRSKELNPVEFLVNSEISNLMSTILRLMGERIKTEFVRGKNIGKITMDLVQFQQVIINLVVNAKDAMKNGGKLSISTSLENLKAPQEAVMATIPPGDYIVISIKDQGEGIKKENFKKIFQTHFSTKGEKGNGLGLSTVAKIMQENSGFIALESTVNEGTSFHLYFAVNKENASVDEAKEEEKLVLQNYNDQDITIDLTGTGTILLVEDEIPVRTVCKRALVNKGYQVIEAEDAEMALTLLQNLTNKVDLIISDVMMPGISGLEFISEAKKIKPNLKAILMSGYAEDTLEDNHYTLDSIEFLAKPFSPDVLATKVKKVITS